MKIEVAILRLLLAVVGVGLGCALAPRGNSSAVEGERSVGLNPGPEAESGVHYHWDSLDDLTPREKKQARLALADEMQFDEIEARLAELDLPHDYDLAQRLLVRLAANDGARAMHLTEGLGVPEFVRLNIAHNSGRIHYSHNLWNEVLSEWAKHDTQEALEFFDDWVAQQPEWSPDVESAVEYLTNKLSGFDSERARALADQYGRGDWFDTALASRSLTEILTRRESGTSDLEEFEDALGRYARLDPEAAFGELMALPEGAVLNTRTSWIDGVFNGERKLKLRQQFAREPNHNWSEEVVQRERWGGSGMQDWAVRRPGEALAWAESLEDPEESEYYRASALVGASLGDPEWVAGQLETLPPDRQAQVMLAMAAEWGARDPSAAEAWVDGIADTDLRERVRDQMEQP